MRGPRLYSLLFWILWGVMSLMVRPDDRNSPEFVIATGIGSFVFPILLYMWCKADAAPIALAAVQSFDFFQSELREVIFCCYSREDYGSYRKLLSSASTRVGS
jgi:hypothetical protein